jgi:phospholipase C
MRHHLALILSAAVAAIGGGSGAFASSLQSEHLATPPQVSLTSPDVLPVPGDRITFEGVVKPSQAGRQVALQQLLPHGWRTIARLRLSLRSTFSLARVLRAAGTYNFRAVLTGSGRDTASYSNRLSLTASEIHKIKHVVVIMQENRSFDHYFGTFRGAKGIPGLAGNPGRMPCLHDPVHGGCDKPFHDRSDVNYGGPHFAGNAPADMDCGNPSAHKKCRMDGFVAQAETLTSCATGTGACSRCRGTTPGPCIDVMGYHTGADIPNYWRYARDFVLQDHMFQSDASWSLTAHLYLVSGWSAICSDSNNPRSCRSSLSPVIPKGKLLYAWTDLTWLLHKHGLSWRYYIFKGVEPDCEKNTNRSCAPVQQGPQTPGWWNPLPAFTDVSHDRQLRNVQSLNGFFAAADAGRLPSVSWIMPSGPVSEHAMYPLSAGQTYVTGLVNTIMQSPDWKSTAIFLAWDDWSGYYDNAVPPAVDHYGYGLRVPAMVISPYAKRSHIDHQTLSFDAYNKFIEDDFLNGQRLNPRTDGRPDPRPDVRESMPVLGNLIHDFNFGQPPRSAVLLPVCPRTDLSPRPTC